MEDLRITGYNALLTPAFLQEEFPTVSKPTVKSESIGLSFFFFYSLKTLKRLLLKLVKNYPTFFKVKMTVLLLLLVPVLFMIPKLLRNTVSLSMERERERKKKLLTRH